MGSIVKKILLKVAAVFCIQIMVLISVCFPVFAGNGKPYTCENAHTFDSGEVTKERRTYPAMFSITVSAAALTWDLFLLTQTELFFLRKK